MISAMVLVLLLFGVLARVVEGSWTMMAVTAGTMAAMAAITGVVYGLIVVADKLHLP